MLFIFFVLIVTCYPIYKTDDEIISQQPDYNSRSVFLRQEISTTNCTTEFTVTEAWYILLLGVMFGVWIYAILN
jgi:hypothetical protein